MIAARGTMIIHLALRNFAVATCPNPRIKLATMIPEVLYNPPTIATAKA